MAVPNAGPVIHMATLPIRVAGMGGGNDRHGHSERQQGADHETKHHPLR